MQPVLGWDKKPTERENQAAGDLSYGPRYRRIVEGITTLRDRGMAMFDLGDIYRYAKGSVYADQIRCSRGYSIAESRGYALMGQRDGGISCRNMGIWPISRE